MLEKLNNKKKENKKDDFFIIDSEAENEDITFQKNNNAFFNK